ncbi:MAG: hypothetical protein LJF06_14615 [Gemmatimonadetes bacterium]|nr:hypothetical protein [Gemmatimonadota bacterium]
MKGLRWWALVLALALAAGGTTAAALRHTSATFDEIVLVAGGLRGLERGTWGLVTSQPPLMMYAYGAAASTASPALPPEKGEVWSVDRGWEYARTLFFRLGNDPVLVLDRARMVGVGLVVVLVLSAGLLAAWVAGPTAGGLAALMVAATPDVLAHGGVAYDDLPLALAFLLAVWALDVAVRRPTPARGAGAGVVVALALGVKLSALALLPVGVLLVAMEATTRRRDRGWWIDLGVSVVMGLLAAWATLMLLYRGDPTLTYFRLAFWRTVLHTEAGHPGAAYLLGHTSHTGWWYFYPVVFLFKTPAAFQVLLLVGAAALLGALRAKGDVPAMWRSAVRWRGRGPVVGALVFGAFLMASHLDIGFRYALPVLPLLAVLTAAGLARLWRRGRRERAVIAVLLGLQVVSVATAYPDLLAYTSVWAGGRDRAHRVLVDSSLDWGQGLLELRRFMKDEGVKRVRLSYFGSAIPAAYGIDYVPLPSFFRLEGGDTGGPPPRFTVISATTLHGLYLQGHDPFASYRSRTPYRVLGHTMLVYDDGTGASGAPGAADPGRPERSVPSGRDP